MLSEMMMSIGILMWLFQSVVGFVILMNFLIAIVSDAYADVMESQMKEEYRTKVELSRGWYRTHGRSNTKFNYLILSF